jgi:hypothetical protein
LPSEVQLSEQLGIATVTLRESLAALREQAPSRREVVKQITAQFEQIFVSLEPLAAAFAELGSSADQARPEGIPKLARSSSRC